MERFSSSARGSAAGGIRTFASGTMPDEAPAASPSAGRSRCIVIPRWSGTSGPPSDTINARSMAFCSQRVRGPSVKTLRPHPLPNRQTCHVRSGTVYTEALESQDRRLQVAKPDDTLDGDVAQTRRGRVQVTRALGLRRRAGRKRSDVEEADDRSSAARDVGD